MVNRKLFRRKNHFGRRFFESKSRSKSHRSERQEENGAPAGTRRIRNQYHFLGASGYRVKALDRRIMVRRVSWSKFSCARCASYEFNGELSESTRPTQNEDSSDRASWHCVYRVNSTESTRITRVWTRRNRSWLNSGTGVDWIWWCCVPSW